MTFTGAPAAAAMDDGEVIAITADAIELDAALAPNP